MKAALLVIALAAIKIATSFADTPPTITEMWIGKTAFYKQLGDNEPELDPTHPYYLGSQTTIDGGNLIKATITNPFGVSYNYILYTSKKGSICSEFRDINALNNSFPPGNYTIDILSTTGRANSIIQYKPTSFPTAPRILAGNNTVWINNYLYVINNHNSCSFSWTKPDQNVENISIALDNDFLLDELTKSTLTYTLDKSVIESLPFNTPIPFYVHFFSDSSGVGTHVYLYKINSEDDSSVFKISKNHAFVQSGNSDPSDWGTKNSTEFFYDYGPYSFAMESGRSGSVISPKGNNLTLSFNYPNRSVYNSGPVSSKDELDRLFPEGTYTLGNQTATLSGSTYPNKGFPVKILSVNGKTPQWNDGKLVLNTKVKNIIKWTPFAISAKDFCNKGIIEFKMDYIDPYIQNYANKESGLLSDSKKTFNSYTIDANSLSSDRDYFISIKYFLASSVNNETKSGGGYSTSTYVWISPADQ